MKQSEPAIVTMGPGDEDRILEVCELLVRSFRDLKPTGAHPLGFWQRVGYTVVGVIPDAEGPGKPTILLAKRTERGA